MRITVLCSDPGHPVVARLKDWTRSRQAEGHVVELLHGPAGLDGGDLLFLVSCSRLVKRVERERYAAALVLHASDLPQGRGWSPHIWTVLGGAGGFAVSLIEAADPVDTGAIWLKTYCSLEGHELLPEIEAKLFAAELELMSAAVAQHPHLAPVPQSGEAGPYLRRRTPADSRLDPEKSLAEQFELLRVADAVRFPAFFEHRGHRYLVKIEKAQP